MESSTFGSMFSVPTASRCKGMTSLPPSAPRNACKSGTAVAITAAGPDEIWSVILAIIKRKAFILELFVVYEKETNFGMILKIKTRRTYEQEC
jgi:hypothetical protein